MSTQNDWERDRMSSLLDQALPQDERYTAIELAALSGMPITLLERFWRALGFPNPGRELKAFGDWDLEIVRNLQSILSLRGAETEPSVQMARVIGSSMVRIAEAEIAASLGPGPTQAGEEGFIGAPALDWMSRVLDYSWRRHLQAALRRAVASVDSSETGLVNPVLAVGFADLVGFTVASQQMTESELLELVGRFEETAHETVTAAGGRVVKMIGDAAMYVAEDPAAATDIALSLTEAYADDDILPEVRVGLAFGPALARDADYFGPVVNLASRIVNIAAPSSVLVSDPVHEAIDGKPEFEWRSLRPRFLKDLGRVHLWRVRRAGEDDPRWRSMFRLPRPGMRLGPDQLLDRIIPGAVSSALSDAGRTRGET